MSSFIEVLTVAVLMLAASAMVLLHIRLYLDWKARKAMDKEHEEFMKAWREELEKEAKKDEAGNS